MQGREISVKLFTTSEGRVPFEDWIESLLDKRAQQRILARIARLRLALFGDCKSVGTECLNFGWITGRVIAFILGVTARN